MHYALYVWVIISFLLLKSTYGQNQHRYKVPIKCGHSSANLLGRGQRRERHQEIYGGSDAAPGHQPWQVQLLNGGNHICGGSLIHVQWILTAAHCVTEPDGQYGVVLGDIGRVDHWTVEPSKHRQRFKIRRSNVHPHPRYSREGLLNDIALLKLDKEAKLSPSVGLVCLPQPKFFTVTPLSKGRIGMVSGWGLTNTEQLSKILQVLRIPYVEKCNSKTLYKSNCFTLGFDERGRATGGACYGDSGGPVTFSETIGSGRQIHVLRGVQFAISDPRFPDDPDEDHKCGVKGARTFGSDVEHHMPWIRHVTGLLRFW